MKSTLTNEQLIEKAKQWIKDLCESGGHKWCLRVPADHNHDPDLIFSELCNRLEEYAQQSQPSGMRWVREKPANDREFVLVTASLINGEWHYHGWEIIEVPDGYFALCELHGEEWGPYEDLSAEYYLVLSPVSESSPAGAAEGASEGMAEALRKKIKGMTLYMTQNMPITEADKISAARCEAYNIALQDVLSALASLSTGVEDNQTKKQ